MRLDKWRDETSHETTFRLVLTERDYEVAILDDFDRALLADCEKPDATISDNMLALETLTRRIEQGGRLHERSKNQTVQ